MLGTRPTLETPPGTDLDLQDIHSLLELKRKFEFERRRKFGFFGVIDQYYVPDLTEDPPETPLSERPATNGHKEAANGGPALYPPAPPRSIFEFLDSDLSVDMEEFLNPKAKTVIIGFDPEVLRHSKYDQGDGRHLPPSSTVYQSAFVERKVKEPTPISKTSREPDRRLPESRPLIKDPQLPPPKPKKNEFSIVITSRMSIFERKRIKVSKEDATTTFPETLSKSPCERRTQSRSKLQTLLPDQIASFKARQAEERYDDAIAAVIKNQRFFQRNDFESNMSKLASYAAKAVRKATAKTKKTDKDFSIRAKKLHKEMLVYWKRRNKELNELKKKKEKLELEIRRKEEERMEQENQKKKIEYLITQSAFYAQIMASKLGTQVDQKMAGDQLIALGADETKNAQKSVMDMINENKERVHELDLKRNKTGSHAHGHGHSHGHGHTNGAAGSLSRGASRHQPETEINQAQLDGANFDFSNVNITSDSKLVDIPSHFHGVLKEYQLKGLRWLDNLYEQGINGILADEMGLGKTIQALALLAHISERKNNWGPFLVIAPSTTLFNWHNETQRFCPHLKVLPYWGTLKERKSLRRYLQQQHLGRRDSTFNIVITSYQIAVLDERILQRLSWSYIVLDEAQAIKNIKGQRWNTLLSLKSRNKLLLTGTPIQNTMAELWALLHFIMPNLFDSHEQFQEWFSKDIEAHSQNKARLDQTQLNRLHAILKPFMLRRVKKDVEKEIGQKHEYEILCKLTPRQQVLYDKIRSKICLADLFSLHENQEKAKNLMNLVMQFRKVCNHPDLFERKMVRSGVIFSRGALRYEPPSYLVPCGADMIRTDEYQNPLCVRSARCLEKWRDDCLRPNWWSHLLLDQLLQHWRLSGQSRLHFDFWYKGDLESLVVLVVNWHYAIKYGRKPTLLRADSKPKRHLIKHMSSSILDTLHPLKESCMDLGSMYIERVVAQAPRLVTTRPHINYSAHFWRKVDVLTPKMEFPTFMSLILDSSKLTYLDTLLLRLKAAGKRCLIFCQMTKMMDILEEFLQWRQYHYFRLDGACNLSSRRDMVGEYQRNPDIFVFLLSTRAGGLGVTLTAADVVIFYDNDWNPTMDAQAADRAHRIGRTEDVEVYRLISKDTIEDKIVKRAQQKKNVQQTVYSGEALKGTVFKSSELLKILIDERGPTTTREPKEHKPKMTIPHPKRTGRETHQSPHAPKQGQAHNRKTTSDEFNLDELPNFDFDLQKELDDLMGEDE